MQNSGTKPWYNRSCCREQLFSLAGILQPSHQTPLPKVRESFVEAFFKAFAPQLCLLGKAALYLQVQAVNAPSPPLVDSLLPRGGKSPGQA